MDSLWLTLNSSYVQARNFLGFGSGNVIPFESKRAVRGADKDSLRWSQEWFNQWDDERKRDANVANVVRDEGGYIRAIGYSPHPLNANFSHLPATINAGGVSATTHAYLSSPEFLRTYKPRFNWQD